MNAPEESDKKIKQKIQFFILFGSTLLLIGKFYAFYITNSAAILTDAIESIVNVVAAVISLFAIIFAAAPRDKNHPFGHGKFEFVSASLEGLMIVVAGGMIIAEGIQRLISPVEIQKIDVGIIIISIAGIINFAMGALSIHMGKKHGSIALISGGKHLHSDSYSTLGMVIGLLFFMFTGLHWIDSLLALVFGAIILLTGLGILRKTIANLTDEADNNCLEKILEIISTNREPEWIDVHNLKITIYGGDRYHIDCDLTLPIYYTISQGHDVYERFKDLIIREFSEHSSFSVHFDSCQQLYCAHCKMNGCPVRKEKFLLLKPYTIDRITEDIHHV